MYERATGDKIDDPITRGMHKVCTIILENELSIHFNAVVQVLRKLTKLNGLKKGAREKPCMYIEDLKAALRTNLCTAEKKYSHRRTRIEL